MLISGIKTEAGIDIPVPIHSSVQEYILYFLHLNGDSLTCSPQGRGCTLRSFRNKYYSPTLEKLELKKLPPMRCRHTFISLLVRSAAGKVAHQKLMGHANYANLLINTLTLRYRICVRK